MFPGYLNRLFPYLILAFGVLAVVQLASLLGNFVEKYGLIEWSVRHRWDLAIILAGLAALAWCFVFLGMLRRSNRLPASWTERRWLMDILDRLTNRAELERRVSGEVDSVFIDAAALAATLKAKVVGEDHICDDLAAQIRRRLALKQRGKAGWSIPVRWATGRGQDLARKSIGRRVGPQAAAF